MSSLGLELNVPRFKDLLKNLVTTAVQLQNNPPDGLNPKETLAANLVLEVLSPYVDAGVLTTKKLAYDDDGDRANLIIGYTPPGWVESNGSVSMIGSHFDVVPGNADEWEPGRNPFVFKEEDDRYYGRGTTDCLGHVALITDLFVQLAQKRPALKRAVWAVFIASEENETPGIGIDRLLAEGELDVMKNGPVYWVDTSDMNPCIGCASAITWTLKATGVSGHSGLPDQTINPIEMVDGAVKYLQDTFFLQYKKHEQEDVYKFSIPSSMKPTQVEFSGGSSNQIPAWAKTIGDIRLTPFYDADKCAEVQREYVSYLNSNLDMLPTRGPTSKYTITDPVSGETLNGTLEIELTEPLKGIACDVNSNSFKYLDDATKEVVGESNPFSLTGSLPLVGDMQDQGYDIQLVGYGLDAVYHKPNEYCSLDYMKKGMQILSRVLDKWNK